MSGYTMDDFTVTVDEETGHRIMKFETDSNMLPVEQPDTYGSYNGEYATEQWLEGQEEEGLPTDYDAYDWTYDSAAVIRALGEAGAENVISQLSDAGIVRSVEVLSTYSPRQYNFATDSYRAVWEFDADALDAWCIEHNFDAAEYVQKHHRSYDGFMSFVGSWITDPHYIEGTTQWLKFAAYLRAELDQESQTSAMAEAEFEAYSNSTKAELKTED